jgi:hypothetical protein
MAAFIEFEPRIPTLRLKPSMSPFQPQRPFSLSHRKRLGNSRLPTSICSLASPSVGISCGFEHCHPLQSQQPHERATILCG